MKSKLPIVVFILTMGAVVAFYAITEYQAQAVERRCFENAKKICEEYCGSLPDR